jgi:release factor glutamine methyltransferase
MSARASARQAADRLEDAGLPDARFEAELLTREAAGLSRADFHLDPALAPESSRLLDTWIERRIASREPLAFITGHREFFGRDFAVGPGVLVPRPETELLVELALAELLLAPDAIVIDVGTGSGAVAVSIAAEAPGSRVIATEVSPDAMTIARINATRYAPSTCLVLTDLLSAIRRAGIVLANLPYIPTWEIEALEPEVSKWEPRIALDGGADGMALIRRLVDDCDARLRPRLLALEVGFGQAAPICSELAKHGLLPTVVKDLSGIDRVVCLRWA